MGAVIPDGSMLINSVRTDIIADQQFALFCNTLVFNIPMKVIGSFEQNDSLHMSADLHRTPLLLRDKRGHGSKSVIAPGDKH